MTDDLLTLLRSADPVPNEPGYDEVQTRLLLARATAPSLLPSTRPTRRRLAASGLALAGLAGAFALGQSAATAPSASAAVDFTRDGNDYIVTVTDPERDSADLTAALKDKGFDITLRTVPVSPSLVGALVEKEFSNGTQPLQALQDEACLPGDQCTIGFRVPVDFKGTTAMTFGRQARSGETYRVSTSSLAPGERLACRDLVGQTVPDAASTIAAAGLTVKYRGAPTSNGSGDAQDPALYQAMYVVDVTAQSPTEVIVFAQHDRPAAAATRPGC